MVQLLLQVDDIQSGGRSARNILNPQLTIFSPLSTINVNKTMLDLMGNRKHATWEGGWS